LLAKEKQKMEEMMVKAIRQFKKEHRKAEIRTCAVWEFFGPINKIKYALFHIEYVEEHGGEYKSVEISIRK
jgi:hypothetical protein